MDFSLKGHEREITEIQKISTEGEKEDSICTHIRHKVEYLSPEHRVHFAYLCRFCQVIRQNKNVTKMDSRSLAICWTPTLFGADTLRTPTLIDPTFVR